MRAVARAVGMTAPGLYRYVDGHEDLLDLLGASLYEELIEELVRARDALDPAELIPQLLAMAHAFRNWALAHRHEYGLLFASPLMSAQHTNSGCTHQAGMRFGALFAESFAAMWGPESSRHPTSITSILSCSGCWKRARWTTSTSHFRSASSMSGGGPGCTAWSRSRLSAICTGRWRTASGCSRPCSMTVLPSSASSTSGARRASVLHNFGC